MPDIQGCDTLLTRYFTASPDSGGSHVLVRSMGRKPPRAPRSVANVNVALDVDPGHAHTYAVICIHRCMYSTVR